MARTVIKTNKNKGIAPSESESPRYKEEARKLIKEICARHKAIEEMPIKLREKLINDLGKITKRNDK